MPTRYAAHRLAFAPRPRDPCAKGEPGEATMSDGIQENASPYKWVGTRPIRPDGVPKVTGRAQYGSDLTMPGQLVGRK